MTDERRFSIGSGASTLLVGVLSAVQSSNTCRTVIRICLTGTAATPKFISVNYVFKARNKLTFMRKRKGSFHTCPLTPPHTTSPLTTLLEVILTFEGQTRSSVTSKLGYINYTTCARNLSGTPVRPLHVISLSGLGGGQTLLERPPLSGDLKPFAFCDVATTKTN